MHVCECNYNLPASSHSGDPQVSVRIIKAAKYCFETLMCTDAYIMLT